MKLHDIPPRALDYDGKPYYPSAKNKTADIAPKAKSTKPSTHAKPAPWKARKRPPDETPGPYVPVRHWNNPYRTGDGEIPSALRPGADDHKQWKSLGDRT